MLNCGKGANLMHCGKEKDALWEGKGYICAPWPSQEITKGYYISHVACYKIKVKIF